jgi:hypothetical protein
MLKMLQAATLVMVAATGLVWSQEFRATILGQVQDSSGSVIPSATVRATKVGTNVTTETTTNAEGYFTLVGLDPGGYTVTATASGFKTIRREGIVLQVAQKLNLPMVLEVGQLNQEVTVVGQQELVQSTSASRGLVFDPVQMQEIPLNGRQAFMLMRLSPGVMFTQRQFGASGFSGTRGWDVNGSFVMNGGRSGSNQFLLNGAPISTNGTFNMSPNVEAVQEMKVMVNTYDSQYARSGGGHVNTTLKSGSNEWHGTMFNFWRNRVLDANTRQNNALGVGRGFRNQHQFGGTVGGAIRKNKDFIFFSFEGWREVVPFPSNTSVPPVQMRQGDFSTFVPQGQTGIIRVFDPLTSQPCGGNVTCVAGGVYRRDPFPGNVIPANRISAIGRNILGYYPNPNFQANALANNFTRPDNVGRYRYEQPMVRYDKVITDKDRLNFVFTFQDGSEFRNSNGFDAPAQTGNMPGTVRRDMNYILSYDRTMSATRIFHAQANFNRFVENFPDVSDYNFTIDKLGMRPLPTVGTFPTTLAPRMNVDGFAAIFGNQFVNQSSRQQANFQGNFSEVHGKHSLKYGTELAMLLNHNKSSGRAGGEFSFNDQWTRQHQGVRQGVLDGSSVASILLGFPASGFIAYNDTFLRRQPYMAGFIQDDWRIHKRLTLNLGLRYDVQFPLIEIQNRLNRGFDYTGRQTNSDQIVARWRELAASGGTGYPTAPGAILGGLQFVNTNGQPRRAYNFDFTNIQPRFGFAWTVASKTVIRGGIGIFHRTDTRGNISTGYSLNTDYIRSLNADQTPAAASGTAYSLLNPFPDGVVTPFGNRLGLATGFGGGVSFDNPNRPIPRTRQWSFTIERELGWGMVLEASYVGSRTTQEGRGIQIGDMSRENWDRAQDPANVGFYQQAVANPIFGFARPGTALNSQANVQRRELLRAFPGFNSVFDNVNPSGRVWYNALQVRFEKRMMGDRAKSGALSVTTAYTWSKMMENFLRNDYAFGWQEMRNQVTGEDRTHNFTTAAIWDLPFGKNRAMGRNLNKAANFVVGGWTTNFNLVYQSGVPLGAWRDWEFRCGDPMAGVQRSESQWFFNNRSRFAECWRQLRPFEYRQLPARFHQLRSQTAPQFDLMLSKKFQATERIGVEFRAEAFNALNTPLRGDAPSGNPSAGDFGILPVAQLNFPRNIQLGARIRF